MRECCEVVVPVLYKYHFPSIYVQEKWSLHSFFTTAPQQADVVGNILLFFYKKKKENKTKKNNKILPATSACCGAVVRNECMDHFSMCNEHT
jgi:hypothetical protein